MNPHFQKAIELYESEGIDINRLVGWFLCHGVVILTDRVFALCYHTDSQEIGKAVLYPHSDTLFCVFCSGDMREALGFLKDGYGQIAFERSFKGIKGFRIYEIERLYSKLK